MKEKFYKIVVSYDGSGYNGWQRQKDISVKTIVRELEITFFKVFKKNIKIRSFSRTDAGVHAKEQIAVFSSDLNLKKNLIFFAWNNKLSDSILIKKISYLKKDFNLNKKILGKIYSYSFSIKKPDPFLSKYFWFYKYKIDFEKLKKALLIFIGKKDFKSFAKNNNYKNTIRNINSIKLLVVKKNYYYKLIFDGDGFLYNMIRRIVGALLECSSKENFSIEKLEKILSEKNNNQPFLCAPAHGLILEKFILKNNKYLE